MNKMCSICKRTKAISEFHRKKRTKDGYNYYCKECDRALYYKYLEKKLGRKIKSKEEYLKEAKEKRERIKKIGIAKCTRCKKEKKFSEFYKDSSRALGISNICKECDLARRNAYRRNPKNREKVLATQRKNRRKWSQTEKGKWRNKIRGMLKDSIKRARQKKNSSTIKWVGVDLQTLQEYLVKTYEDRYGEKYIGQEVHIDHKIPISKARNMDEARYLSHWSNLQFLTKEDNETKSDKILPEFRELWKKFLEFRKSLAHA